MDPNPDFLKKKYNLHASEEVEQAVEAHKERTGERVSSDPSDRIQTYLDRLHRLFVQPEEREHSPRSPEDRRAMHLALITQRLHETLLVKPDIATDEYLKRQMKIARAQGHGTLEIPEDLPERLAAAVAAIRSGDDVRATLQQFSHNEEKQMAEEILALIEEQEQSLDLWVDYLSSPDAQYPDWLKYWAIRNILTLSAYDKDAKKFPKRTDRTINPFPDFNPEALSIILDAIAKKYDPDHASDSLLILEEFTPEERARFDALLAGESFPKLFAWAMVETAPASADLLETTDGKWVTYPQGTDHTPLVQSIRRRGTGWCTAGEQTAQSQLSRGDFHVYYSRDREGNPAIPRAAIRMEGDTIAEVRGIAKNQNLDPYIAPIVQNKMRDFPDGDQYMRKAADMQRLTTLEQKAHSDDPLTPDDLRFLYEINHNIQGFGYGDDPRVKELRSTRNPDEDMLVIFDCTTDQIAHVPSQITAHTKAYVGQLEPGIFDHLPPTVEHVYTKFPEGRIEFRTIPIGGKISAQYERELTHHGHRTNDWSRDILQKTPTADTAQSIETVRLTVRDLGFTAATRYDAICARAQELGLDLAPAEAGPALRLALDNQPMDDWCIVAMNPITDRGGFPRLFAVERNADGSWLRASDGYAGCHGDPGNSFVFLRKQHIENRP